MFPMVGFEHFLQGSSKNLLMGECMVEWLTFDVTMVIFARCIMLNYFIVNNIILNLSIKNCQYINMIIMSRFVKLYFENNAFIMNNGLLKFKNMN
jgi:hypothetical protein